MINNNLTIKYRKKTVKTLIYNYLYKLKLMNNCLTIKIAISNVKKN